MVGAVTDEEVTGLVLNEDTGLPAFDAGTADSEVGGEALLGNSHGLAASGNFAGGEQAVLPPVGIVRGEAQGVEVTGA